MISTLQAFHSHVSGSLGSHGHTSTMRPRKEVGIVSLQEPQGPQPGDWLPMPSSFTPLQAVLTGSRCLATSGPLYLLFFLAALLLPWISAWLIPLEHPAFAQSHLLKRPFPDTCDDNATSTPALQFLIPLALCSRSCHCPWGTPGRRNYMCKCTRLGRLWLESRVRGDRRLA